MNVQVESRSETQEQDVVYDPKPNFMAIEWDELLLDIKIFYLSIFIFKITEQNCRILQFIINVPLYVTLLFVKLYES